MNPISVPIPKATLYVAELKGQHINGDNEITHGANSSQRQKDRDELGATEKDDNIWAPLFGSGDIARAEQPGGSSIYIKCCLQNDRRRTCGDTRPHRSS
jgi:hypothetical protein